MIKQTDDPALQEYVQCVLSLWIVSTFPRTYAQDLIPVMMEAGFLIDKVVLSYSSDTWVQWIGSCYDESTDLYKFTATWTLNKDKFHLSEVHYYDLTDLCIEPLDVRIRSMI